MCIFCKIAAGEIPADIVYRDDEAVAFRDLDPKAPTHILVIPVRHVASIAEVEPALAGHLVTVAARVARENVSGDGYRVVANVGPDGGQSVDHLHLHVLGGRPMTWPPG
jgi:histidine triad (HIT) family protein